MSRAALFIGGVKVADVDMVTLEWTPPPVRPVFPTVFTVETTLSGPCVAELRRALFGSPQRIRRALARAGTIGRRGAVRVPEGRP